jgi:hypothetical protein
MAVYTANRCHGSSTSASAATARPVVTIPNARNGTAPRRSMWRPTTKPDTPDTAK